MATTIQVLIYLPEMGYGDPERYVYRDLNYTTNRAQNLFNIAPYLGKGTITEGSIVSVGPHKLSSKVSLYSYHLQVVESDINTLNPIETALNNSNCYGRSLYIAFRDGQPIDFTVAFTNKLKKMTKESQDSCVIL